MKILRPSSTPGPSRKKALAALGASLISPLLGPGMLLAADAASATFLTANEETISLGTAIFKTIGSLVIVIGLMLLLLSWLKKTGLVKTGSRQEGLITVLDNQMLAPKKQVSVLEVGGAYLVVGLTDQQLTLLATLEPNDRLREAAHFRRIQVRNASSVRNLRGKPLPLSFASLLNNAALTISGLKEKRQGPANAE
jgi:flagellar biogenesis protein FliO